MHLNHISKHFYHTIYEGYVFTKPKYTGGIFWRLRENSWYTGKLKQETLTLRQQDDLTLVSGRNILLPRI